MTRLLAVALSRVNWQEVAQRLLENDQAKAGTQVEAEDAR